MELIKENESFKVTDTLENGWELHGTVTKDSNNRITINGYYQLPEAETIGDFYYTLENERVSSNYNVNKKDEEALRSHIGTCVAAILAQLQSSSL